jgi:Cytochrome c554 and c-prime
MGGASPIPSQPKLPLLGHPISATVHTPTRPRGGSFAAGHSAIVVRFDAGRGHCGGLAHGGGRASFRSFQSSPSRFPGEASACALCHSEARFAPSMYQALETVENCRILMDRPLLVTTIGKYSYRIERVDKQSNYTVTDGAQSLTLPIRWALGASSSFGQTYILEKDGDLYESRVSYFRELNGLGPTLGSAGITPADLVDAAGRYISHDEKLRCFGCHATHAAVGKQLTLDQMIPGVQCSRCHESVETHLAAIIQDNYDLEAPKALSKLDRLSAEDASNFCEQCHRTWAEIASQSNPNISNIRFQPYRLTESKCYDTDDPRIGCLACHDPHHEASSRPVDYDSKCLACHGGGKPGAKSCLVAHTGCVTCHMPKLELPGAHHKFSDHRIRVVRPGKSYPG